MPALSSEHFAEAAARFVCDFVERLPTTAAGKPLTPYEW